MTICVIGWAQESCWPRAFALVPYRAIPHELVLVARTKEKALGTPWTSSTRRPWSARWR
jgi:hypothetical protein